MKKKRKPPIAKKLVENSISAMLSAIEIHNKPIFSYRYETFVILFINSRELLLKGYIYKYHRNVKLWEKYNKIKRPKPFLDCLSFVKTQLGKKYTHWFVNIEKIYEYRCSYIHFYGDDIDSLLFLMISENIKFYVKFIKIFFPDIKLYDQNFLILPIGFKPIASVIDVLSNLSDTKDSSNDVKQFVKSLILASQDLAEQGNNNGIFSEYSIKLYNERSSRNSDITAKWSKTGSIKLVSQKEISIIKSSGDGGQIEPKVLLTPEEQKVYQRDRFPLTYLELRRQIREKYPTKYFYPVKDLIKKYKNNTQYAFACSGESKITYSLSLIDLIGGSLEDNPNKPKL